MIAGLIFLYGIYIILHGHLTPGGGFAGGAIIAGAFILLILAFGSSALNLKKEVAGTSNTESVAILMVVHACPNGSFAWSKGFLLQFPSKGNCRRTD